MSHKTSPARRAAFFKALAETGNQTISAERAKVSRSWVQLHRSTDPAFDDACKAAIAEAKAGFEALRADGTMRPPRGWGFLDGEELVVRGSRGRRVQIARARLHQWTPRVEAHFLAVLEATCNVRASCAAVGMSAASAFNHRGRWPDFARRWDEAVRVGYWRVDGALLWGAMALFDPPARPLEPAELPLEPMTVDDAIRLVRIYERRAREAARP